MEMSRISARQEFDENLNRPLDAKQAEQYDRENWGKSPEAIREATRLDELWGDETYG